jgi:hypothetical protein
VRGGSRHILRGGSRRGQQTCWRERCARLLRFMASVLYANMCLHGCTDTRLRDGNWRALKAARRVQYTQRPIRVPSDKETTRPIGALHPPPDVAARKSIMPTLAAIAAIISSLLSLRSEPYASSQAAITLRYCFPHFALADARHLQHPSLLTHHYLPPICFRDM